MDANRIRQEFLDFFRSKGHEIVPSSPVVPFDDPTLMFTNAGMNQFKDVFLGTGSRPYKRAADTQKCIRAGGKHNDLDDVGQDTYHHTFFEMLGNWSFGDYFKKEAIEWAWELLTKVWGIDPTRLHATYFEGNAAEGVEADTEARDLWATIAKMPPSHIHPGNKKDNFWEMGDTGPCGPCSEIHIDLTPDKSGAHLVNKGDHRVMEIWNLVFIQFNRGADGKLTPLPAKHVDTGMGFERLCAVLQGMKFLDADHHASQRGAQASPLDKGGLRGVSNYNTDVFAPIFTAIQKRTSAPKYTDTLPSEPRTSVRATPSSEPRSSDRAESPTSHDSPHGLKSAAPSDQSQIMVDISYRVIADHIRCLTFALTDGAIPSNEGRGYVLRRILRRAVRYGRQYMNMHEPFLCDLVATLVEHMAGAFPELRTAHRGKNVEHVSALIRDEEASFLKTLDRGIKLFAEAADKARTQHHGRITGEDAFKLHDTYGFPIDLTELMAEEQGLTIDVGEYERLMDQARDLARGTHRNLDDAFERASYEILGKGAVTCDDSLKWVAPFECKAYIWSIGMRWGTPNQTHAAKVGEKVLFHTNRTPFYAEQGGQVSDVGLVITENGEIRVTNVVKRTVAADGRIIENTIHEGEILRGEITDGKECTMRVDLVRRFPTMQNHTATHVLNWALREVLEFEGGGKVDQKGSLVDPDKTRFDFSHNKPLTDEELDRVEGLVVDQIKQKLEVDTNENIPVEKIDAEKIETLRRVFGEKYPDQVRVVSIGAKVKELLANPKNPKWMKYSVEFCGGTHVKNTSEIEHFVLVSEEGVAKGVRRVVGISGNAARAAETLGQQLLSEAKSLTQTGPQASACATPSGDTGSRELKFAARYADLQKRLAEAVIPVRLRRQIQAVLLDLQKVMKEQARESAAASGDAALDAVKKLFDSASTIGGVTVVVGEVPPATPDALRGAIDWVRNKSESSAVLLGCAADGKVTLLAGMSNSAVDRGLKAGELIKEICPLVGGKGGGRPDMAQGGGAEPSGLANALNRAREWLAERLK